ncbi:MAG: ROK family protein [Actinomycetota bacterium]
MQSIGLDVGGTKIAALRIDGGGTVRARAGRATPAADAAATLDAMEACVRELLTDDVVGIGAGVAGLVASGPGIVRFSPNTAWGELAVGERLADAFGLPWRVDNDATIAALGEQRFGAGRGSTTMALVTVGTGIGGGFVLDGRPFVGANGFAGEIGHVPLDPDGPACGCGKRGCLETLASGTAIGRYGREAAARDPSSTLARSAPIEAIDGRLVTSLAEGGDADAREAIARAGRWLGVGIAALVDVFDPDLVVVGGGAADAGDLLLDPARAALASGVVGAGHRPVVPVVRAALGNDAGAIGAAAAMFPA